MMVLMGVAACEGPPVLEYEGVDEHAGQDYLNPPEVETIFEEPSSDAEGEIPLPLGFTEESWIEYLLEKVEEGIVVNYGGLDVVVATMDSPLVYEGPVPNVELVFLEQDEMDALGVEPGDHAPGSTALDTRIYALAADPSDIGSAVAGETTSKSWGDTPDINPDGNFWTDEVGSSLAFGSDSSIAITGCSEIHPWVWGFNPALKNRRGTARFGSNDSFTGQIRDVEVFLPSTPCAFPSITRTTLFAQMHVFEFLGLQWFIWLVSEPDVWIDVGEDGWDNITLIGDKDAFTYHFIIKRVVVEHNDKSITSDAVYSPPFILYDEGTNSHNLTYRIWNYKHSLVFYSGNEIVCAAVSDYAQAATFKYPVYPYPDLWYPNFLGGGFKVPHLWCSEFTSWAFRQGADDAGHLGYFTGIPVAESPPNDDIGVKRFWEWADSDPAWDVLVFGQDEQGNPMGIDNGPTDAQWVALADGVKAGDYMGMRNEAASSYYPLTHSMVVVGWLNDEGTFVDSSYFEAARPCNRLLVVDGNVGKKIAHGWQGEPKGLGTIVKVSKRVVCRPYVDPDSGYSIEPDCWIGGVHEECEVRLWDVVPSGLPSVSSFFIDMELPSP
jgi:hypothetical protein